MSQSQPSRGWRSLLVSTVFAALCIVPVVHGSFFYNNLIPPPTGTNPNKEIDPPVLICPPVVICPPVKTTCPPPPVNHAPEPATIVLAALGIAGASAYRRMSKKS